jgi:ABC-type bacteriocin/lantibiotic exporter with double-glycine peptidase domain
MEKLEVPYVKQLDMNSCGIAALQMIYGFYEIKEEVNQEALFEKLKQPEPNGSGEWFVRSINIAKDAESRGFWAGMLQANHRDVKEAIAEIRSWVEVGHPVIVCQQYKKDMPAYGHFRVVYQIDDESIYFHDPMIGPNVKQTHEEFLEYWQPQGKAVVGGQYILIKPRLNPSL